LLRYHRRKNGDSSSHEGSHVFFTNNAVNVIGREENVYSSTTTGLPAIVPSPREPTSSLPDVTSSSRVVQSDPIRIQPNLPRNREPVLSPSPRDVGNDGHLPDTLIYDDIENEPSGNVNQIPLPPRNRNVSYNTETDEYVNSPRSHACPPDVVYSQVNRRYDPYRGIDNGSEIEPTMDDEVEWGTLVDNDLYHTNVV
jgi:hypothetical protein